MDDNIIKLNKNLANKKKKISDLKCCIGFDGFVDSIIRVVQKRKNANEYSPFKTITEFSEHIGLMAGKSGDMEIVVQEVKLGGNAPIMANAIASQGINCQCIGAMGFPEIHAAFQVHNEKFIPVSICQPAKTLAFEFGDGKLMFGDSVELHKLDWEFLKTKVGLIELIKVISESNLIGIVNWSYLGKMDTIIQGIISEIFPSIASEILQQKFFFFDIADPSTRSKEDLLLFLKQLEEMNNNVKVVLGLNEKEAFIVHKILGLNQYETDIKQIAKSIIKNVNISMVVVHGLNYAISIMKNEIISVKGFYVDNPKCSTGGGDNFNAGFCFGLLLELPNEQSLTLGNATASFYVSNGYSPSYMELQSFIKNKL
ncbi:PfkB family carbohydrate kinase [Clostridium bowmanii]|uniref:PfkB family carbohydrate kinase n=1 Tax=Clostridium bowmanii TaxID=132925 RepID=UPI001C0E50EC|nr:PfkB family carbohydrate kinase [Clostridium bowmanii]MBU3191028.1 hypothetical protein [Clostridium bowmanii]MCA1075351.1 PfkB family carbohydrate kinase [Clostridium bowmanii]